MGLGEKLSVLSIQSLVFLFTARRPRARAYRVGLKTEN